MLPHCNYICNADLFFMSVDNIVPTSGMRGMSLYHVSERVKSHGIGQHVQLLLLKLAITKIKLSQRTCRFSLRRNGEMSLLYSLTTSPTRMDQSNEAPTLEAKPE